MMRLRTGIGLGVFVAVVVSGCGDGGDASREPRPAAERDPGPPAGGLEAWVADIVSGMPENGAAMVESWRAEQERLLDLYMNRLEFVEVFWGPNGRLQAPGGEALGAAVTSLEMSFHEVIKKLVGVPLDTAAVLAAAAQVRREATAVVAAGKASGLPLVPPVDTASAIR